MNQTPEKPEEDETPRPASIYLAKEKPPAPPVQSVDEVDVLETAIPIKQPLKPGQGIDDANELFKQLSESSTAQPEAAEEPKE